MDLKEAVAGLKEHSTDEVAKALQIDYQTVWQSIHDVGFSTANDKAKTKISTAEDSLKEAQDLLEEKGVRIIELEKNTPDLEGERTRHREAIDKLKAQQGIDVDSLTSKLVESHRKRVRAQIRAKMSNVDDDYAEVQADLAMSRIQFADDNSGSFEAMNENEVAFVPADGKSAIDLLVAERVGKIDNRFIKSNVDRSGAGPPSDPGSPGGDKGLYDKMRTIAKELSGDEERARAGKVKTMFGISQN